MGRNIGCYVGIRFSDVAVRTTEVILISDLRLSMTWFDVVQHEVEDQIEIVAKTGFARTLAPQEVAGVVQTLSNLSFVQTGKR
jgi:hypothetical protein